MRDRTGALLIPAHPDGEDGLFTTVQPGEAAKIISEVRPDAIEHFSDTDINRLASTGIMRSDELRRIASVEFSDPKEIGEIGTKLRPDGVRRATYLNLSTLDDIEAIRLALHDPEVRVRVGEAPRVAHTWLRAVRIEGSGFLGSSSTSDTALGGR